MEKEKLTETYIASIYSWLRYSADELTSHANTMKADVEELLESLDAFDFKKEGLRGLLSIISHLEKVIECDICDLDKLADITHRRGNEILDRIEYKQSQ